MIDVLNSRLGYEIIESLPYEITARTPQTEEGVEQHFNFFIEKRRDSLYRVGYRDLYAAESCVQPLHVEQGEDLTGCLRELSEWIDSAFPTLKNRKKQ